MLKPKKKNIRKNPNSQKLQGKILKDISKVESK